MSLRRLLSPPTREYSFLFLLVIGFAFDFWTSALFILPPLACLAVLPTLWAAMVATYQRRITIDTFNAFAIAISFATGEFRSAGFIALMLVSARLLDWHTESRTRNSMEELLKLKPTQTVREQHGSVQEIRIEDVRRGDILIVKQGSRVPVDGVVIHGTSHVNEASVTGESKLVTKTFGDEVLSSTLVESGLLKIRATRVGKDSTIERMVTLMQEAALHKSHAEKIADRFARTFLPIVAVLGVATYLITGNISMTAALLLVACADDMSVAIPLAMTASLGQAAKRGVLIKGGEYLDVLARIKLLVLDKTGTLTYGTRGIKEVRLAPGIDEDSFWKLVGMTEKYSEHPVGRVAFKESVRRVKHIPDPDDVRVYTGSGIWARYDKDEVVVCSDLLVEQLHLEQPPSANTEDSHFFVYLNRKHIGTVILADIPRKEAQRSLKQLQSIGIERVIMFTGDKEDTAMSVARTLGIKEVRASMTPERKLRELEELSAEGSMIAMIGDGINDAPALARANVGIAMGGGGTAVAAEAADVIILNDNLDLVPEMVLLGRKTTSVIRADMAIWFVTNIFGFLLVWSGVAGPALAAFYNFATDFLPLINSSRLFKNTSSKS